MRIFLLPFYIVLVSNGAISGDTREIGLGYAGRRYDGHQLLRVFPRTRRETHVLEKLKNNKDIKAEFWHSPNRPTPYLDILLDPKHQGIFHTILKGHSIRYVVSHPNFQDLVDEQFAVPENAAQSEAGIPHEGISLDKYNNFDQIVSWLFQQQEKHPGFLKVSQIGSTVEGRPIYTAKHAMMMGNTKGSERYGLMRASIPMNGVGPATMLHFIQKLITEYESDPQIAVLVDTFDWYITPVLNVDGYSYTWMKDRLWRKNRRQAPGSDCVGVDLNRNWGAHWGEVETAANDPCDRMYIGPSAMSEPEIQSVAEFLRQQNGSVVAYLAYHSFGQLWMTPFSYSKSAPLAEQQELLNMSYAAVNAIEKVHGTKYRVGRISELVGEASGASVDYTYESLGIKYSFGIELRDDGRYGTLLPPSQIKPNAEESFEGLKKLATMLYEKLH